MLSHTLGRGRERGRAKVLLLSNKALSLGKQPGPAHRGMCDPGAGSRKGGGGEKWHLQGRLYFSLPGCLGSPDNNSFFSAGQHRRRDPHDQVQSP